MSSELFKNKNETGNFTFSSNFFSRHVLTNKLWKYSRQTFNNSEKNFKVNLFFSITQNYQTKWWNE